MSLGNEQTKFEKAVLSPCRQWLEVDLLAPHTVLSWAVMGGGRTEAQYAFWHHVNESDLSPHVDPKTFLEDRRRRRAGNTDGVGFLTGSPLEGFIETFLEMDDNWARCITTVGLANALRIGDTPSARFVQYGTINIFLQTSMPLTESAFFETLSLVSEARTLAVFEGGVTSNAGPGIATGTGTDCIVIAAPMAYGPSSEAIYAGKHTLIGHLVGGCVYKAVTQGVENWKQHVLTENEKTVANNDCSAPR